MAFAKPQHVQPVADPLIDLEETHAHRVEILPEGRQHWSET